jgi:hypothetical protein
VTCNRRHILVLSSSTVREISPTVLVLVFFLILFASASPSSAGPQKPQDPKKTYALIFGTVWGPDDRPVYGVPVKIRRADQKKAKWQLQSDHRGEFAQRLPAGKADYIVWADFKEFKSLNGNKLTPGEPVTVHIEGDERTDIGLHLK